MCIIVIIAQCNHGERTYAKKCKHEMGVLAHAVSVLRETQGYIEHSDQRLMSDLIKFYANTEVDIFPIYNLRLHGNDVLDPLDNPYQIRFNNEVVTLWSYGINGIDEKGEGDDIKLIINVAPPEKK